MSDWAEEKARELDTEVLCQADEWRKVQAVATALREAEARGRASMKEEAALYCENNAMGMSIRRDGPFGGWRASEADHLGSHPGKGYAAAIRALP